MCFKKMFKVKILYTRTDIQVKKKSCVVKYNNNLTISHLIRNKVENNKQSGTFSYSNTQIALNC